MVFPFRVHCVSLSLWRQELGHETACLFFFFYAATCTYQDRAPVGLRLVLALVAARFAAGLGEIDLSTDFELA